VTQTLHVIYQIILPDNLERYKCFEKNRKTPQIPIKKDLFGQKEHKNKSIALIYMKTTWEKHGRITW
jgi:hypothetical protein